MINMGMQKFKVEFKGFFFYLLQFHKKYLNKLDLIFAERRVN